ncbi:MAG: S-layer homology domain-containing protein [Oscillospiraceae bacterium]|jgi:hypothetical protein|nr:S-layer homology domain-containing protein [Oscillospiraceae bacterium]
MKKTLYTLICVVLLLAVTLGAAGGASDPLVTRRWLENEYRATLLTDLAAAIEKSYANQLLALTSKIESGTPLVPPSGYALAPAKTAVTVSPGQTLNLAPGAAFTVQSGTVSVTLLSGFALDLTDGEGTLASFTPTARHRYFVTESSQAAVEPVGRATLLVDGYIKLDGDALTHHPVFTDVPADAWFYAAVDYAYKNGLFSGTSATTFSPNTEMTRGMFVTVLGRLAGIDISAGGDAEPDDVEEPEENEPAVPQFTDVAEDAYYAPYVAWAAESEIVLGYSDGTFKPNQSVTREQMAALMFRYEVWQGNDTTVSAAAAEAMPDYNKVAEWAQESIRWAVANKIINGSDGKLLPQDTATRAQVAQIIMNYQSR